MASPGYGDNGSVIGPQNLPTSSAASGVWSLGEYSEAQRDGIWPNPSFTFEKIATSTPSGATSLTFSGIPATYRHLQIVAFSSQDQAVYSGSPLQSTNNAAGSSGYNYMFQEFSGNVGSTTVMSNMGASQSYGRVGYEGNNTMGSVFTALWTNYEGTSAYQRGAGQPHWFEGAAFNTSSGNSQGRPVFGGSEHDASTAGAITSITLTGGGNTFMADAVFVLYGWRNS